MFDREYDLRIHIRDQACVSNAISTIEKALKPVPLSSEKSGNELRPKKEYICPVCDNHFKTYQKYRNHEVIHTGNYKPFVCETCGKNFRYANNLYQHKFTHGNERKYQCTLCPKVFKRLAGLNQVNKDELLKKLIYNLFFFSIFVDFIKKLNLINVLYVNIVMH